MLQVEATERFTILEMNTSEKDIERVLSSSLLPSSPPRKRGTGLGVAITHGIIECHGGKIEAQSEVGKGSTFTVYLSSCVLKERP